MIYVVFVEHTSSIRSFCKIATTNKQKAQEEFDNCCQYFFNYAQHEDNAKLRHWDCSGCTTFVDCCIISSDKSKHIIHFDKFEE